MLECKFYQFMYIGIQFLSGYISRNSVAQSAPTTVVDTKRSELLHEQIEDLEDAKNEFWQEPEVVWGYNETERGYKEYIWRPLKLYFLH